MADSTCCIAIGTFAVIAAIIYFAYCMKSNFYSYDKQPLFYSPNSNLRVSYDPNLYGTGSIVNLASMNAPWYL